MRVFIAILILAGIVAWMVYGDMGSLMDLIDRLPGP